MARRIAVYISLFLLLQYLALYVVFAVAPLADTPALAAFVMALTAFLAIVALWKSWASGVLLRGVMGMCFGVCAVTVGFADASPSSNSNLTLFESAPDAQQRVTMLTLDERRLKLANGDPCLGCQSSRHIFVVSWACEIPNWLAWSGCGAASFALLGPPLLRPWLQRRKSVWQCQKCGYDLTGNVSGVCPECGSKV
jgi:hypothetical protein